MQHNTLKETNTLLTKHIAINHFTIYSYKIYINQIGMYLPLLHFQHFNSQNK
jgi:hypothetical protein